MWLVVMSIEVDTFNYRLMVPAARQRERNLNHLCHNLIKEKKSPLLIQLVSILATSSSRGSAHFRNSNLVLERNPTHAMGDSKWDKNHITSYFPENVQHWEASEIAPYCLQRTMVVLCNGLFWSVSCPPPPTPLQAWSRSMPCPSRATMSCVSTWRTLKIAPRTPSTVPLEWASSRWTLMMMDTLWPWGTILATQVYSAPYTLWTSLTLQESLRRHSDELMLFLH